MKKIIEVLKLIDNHILTVLLCAFAFVIPLYPKIPLRVVNYTYVAIRLEDYFIAIIALVFIIQYARKKITIPKRFILPFILFWIVVFVSYYVGYFVTKTIPFEFQKVGFYHALRRIEYMMVFFLVASAVRSTREFKLFLSSSLSALFLVGVYGIFQRFYDFPAIQTMNPEYAKGRIVFLTEEARLSSTFGGHYDLSAYLVFMIPLVFGVYLLTKGILAKEISFTEPITRLFEYIKGVFFKFSQKLNLIQLVTIEEFRLDRGIIIPIALIGSLVVMLFGFAVETYELRITLLLIPSLIIFLLLFRFMRSTILLVLVILLLFIMTFTSSRVSIIAYFLSVPVFIWFMRRYFLAISIVILSVLIMMTNQALIQRFFKTFQIKQFLVNEQTGETHVVQRISTDELPAGTQIVMKVGKQRTTADEELIKKEIIARSITPTPAPKIRNPIKPIPIASAAAQFTEIFAVATDISFSTRLQVEWPRAIGAFMQSPLIGTGPSSITEATDNDYLRWLGETGILGFGLFVFILLHIAHFIIRRANQLPSTIRPLFFAPIFGLVGLMINAAYIDVFEASKVAFTFWYIMGTYVGVLRIKN
ncbi:hypothetical protein A3H80_03890 [Candidatus Roizmanbacteria bacterium RIFCSPLOWO2_02_FULL_37_19]|uniref:O-antigen ligase-related domain-containing protein n=1 Tax=Candidatus Roizmanbacteria bacterium RIFCSPHIGHO2_02_FULL_37_24 TaxID=1802037 RepID=A0A1F7GXM3_9BACT|nr:MAG: hypothetical protein A2862_03850 [Candidatus Roizmanbacteria bacterium RIFCSPHIGHO2_01_FULL_38_41]OGK23306.1 MAG: hypothetical protein A3C24_03880 [Candidatus Roizmanbacteria bacterium RIFCSPHIGHO2_02_FULL_37_24]OGK32319.1 MAG: hypothetical protein A3E10_04120 [Candidatus Roizmanbacteria bacterium RIFCSPHIGHO2_12_FULL_37_23]OGK44651.1 MAG: hypothetical protein A2956_03795 [Candidatus Roizmanbacteria bacterium RIFCSPLOWO2_01_FULL_37_57]OGK54837.1 MAG: hypothetical protein A3H80_03890 [Ca